MKVNFYGKNLTIRDSVKQETEKKLSRLNKYFQDSVEAQVTMAVEGSRMRCDITIPIPGASTILRAEQSADELMDAVDLCISGLVSQIRKYRTKLEKRRYAQESIRFAEIEPVSEEEQVPEDVDIARVKEVELAAMTPEEAVDQMELLGHDFFLFLNMEVDAVCCVYRRKAGNYGILIPKN